MLRKHDALLLDKWDAGLFKTGAAQNEQHAGPKLGHREQDYVDSNHGTHVLSTRHPDMRDAS